MKIVLEVSKGKAYHIMYALQDAAIPYREKAAIADGRGLVHLTENYRVAARALENAAISIQNQLQKGE